MSLLMVSESGVVAGNCCIDFQRFWMGLLLRRAEAIGRQGEVPVSALVLDGEGRATLVLREGRTHQVRRMIRALGGRVVGLHRDRVGGLDLPPDLAPGDLRPLAPAERALLLTDSSL